VSGTVTVAAKARHRFGTAGVPELDFNP